MKCQVCKKESEDMRHVSIDCFYDVKEVVSGVQESPFFQEVPHKNSCLGSTRKYSKGVQYSLEHSKTVVKKGITCHVLKKKRTALKAITLSEKTLFTLRCCKSCRGDFLSLLKEWSEGKHISREGTGNIPVRINGAIKMLTEKQWAEYSKKTN